MNTERNIVEYNQSNSKTFGVLIRLPYQRIITGFYKLSNDRLKLSCVTMSGIWFLIWSISILMGYFRIDILRNI